MGLINRSPMSKAEDRLIMSLHKELGNKWAEIAHRLPDQRALRENWLQGVHKQHLKVQQQSFGQKQRSADEDYDDDVGPRPGMLSEVAELLASSQDEAKKIVRTYRTADKIKSRYRTLARKVQEAPTLVAKVEGSGSGSDTDSTNMSFSTGSPGGSQPVSPSMQPEPCSSSPPVLASSVEAKASTAESEQERAAVRLSMLMPAALAARAGNAVGVPAAPSRPPMPKAPSFFSSVFGIGATESKLPAAALKPMPRAFGTPEARSGSSSRSTGDIVNNAGKRKLAQLDEMAMDMSMSMGMGMSMDMSLGMGMVQDDLTLMDEDIASLYPPLPFDTSELTSLTASESLGAFMDEEGHGVELDLDDLLDILGVESIAQNKRQQATA